MRPMTTCRPAIALLLLAPGVARAAGYYVTGVGVRGMGRAAANVVGADDLSAQYYNPAALTRIRSQVGVQLAGVHQGVYFDRADELQADGSTLGFDPVTNSAPPMPIPALGLATSFGQEDLTVALGVYTPYAPMLSFPQDGPQRFSLVDSTVLSGNVGPSVAYRFADRLSVGVGVAYTFLQVEQSLSAHMAPETVEETDLLEYDIRTTITAMDPFAITWNAGLLYEPPDANWAVGLAFVPPVNFQASGSLEADLSDNAYRTGATDFGELILVDTVVDDEVMLDITMPMVLRAGGMLKMGDKELELDVAWQRWSNLGQLSVTGLDLVIDLSTAEDAHVSDDIVLPTTFQDAVSVRLGGQHRVRDRFTGRLGLLFETSAVHEYYQAVMMPDGLKFGYGLGGTVHLVPDKLDLDFGLCQSFVPRHELDRTLVRQVAIDPLTGVVHEGKDVGKGTFGVTNTVFGLGMTWSPGGGEG
jgi:long-chain fatty acid transport protein